MKYYKYYAAGPNVLSNLEFKIQLEEISNKTIDELEDFLNDIGYEYCIENWESYSSISEFEEENDVEWEAYFSWEELTEEEFNECDLQEYFL